MDSTGSPADDGSGRDMFEVEMKRYVIDELSYKRRLIESPDGDWVRYEDAQAEIERLQALADERGRRMEELWWALTLYGKLDAKKDLPDAFGWFKEDGSVK